MFLSALPVIGTVVEKILGVVDKCVEDKDQAAKLKADLQAQLLNQDFSVEMKALESQASIIAAEAQGASWLQRNWRPLLMLTFTYIVAHNYIISPMFSLQRLEIPPDMWELLKLGMGGYILGRSAEKCVEAWKK